MGSIVNNLYKKEGIFITLTTDLISSYIINYTLNR